jgi:hypothetical protein
VGIGTDGELRLVAHERIKAAVREARDIDSADTDRNAAAAAILARHMIKSIGFDLGQVTRTPSEQTCTRQHLRIPRR